MLKPIFLAVVICTLVSCGEQGGTSPKPGADTTSIKSDTLARNSAHDSIPPDADLQADLADTTDDGEEGGGLWSAANSLIPEGYSMKSCAVGDLNVDGLPDGILVYKKNDEDSTSDGLDHPARRSLLLLIQEKGKGYKVAARSDQAVLCVNCGGLMGDPYEEAVVEKPGIFYVKHSGGSNFRWSRNIVFKYNPTDNNWYLDKDERTSYQSTDPHNKEEEILTVKDFGKVPFATFDVYKDQ